MCAMKFYECRVSSLGEIYCGKLYKYVINFNNKMFIMYSTIW